ncbi:MAG: hypothetical protein ACRDPB_00590 [Nocardioidaceae bacterium]
MPDRPPDAYRTSDRRVIPWLLVGLLVIFGGVYVAGYVLTSDRLPRGTTVAGVPLGGLTEPDAELRLSGALADRETAPITLTANGTSGQVLPVDTGLTVDILGSVAQAGASHSWRPAQMWRVFTGGTGTSYPAVVRVDTSRLSAALAKFASHADESAHDGSVVFHDGRAFPRYPKQGSQVDRPAAARTLRSAYLHSTDVVLPTQESQPTISQREVERAMETFGNPAISAPLVFRLGNRTVVIRPDVYADALSMTAHDGQLVPHVADKQLLRLLRPQLRSLVKAPRDARVVTRHGHPQVVKGRKGRTYRPANITGDFVTLVVAQDQNRTRVLPGKVVDPDVTTSDARKKAAKKAARLGAAQQPAEPKASASATPSP